MPLEDRLSKDIKEAMLARQSQRVSVLRSIKSSLQYYKVANNLSRDDMLADSDAEGVLAKEVKKRQESADLYVKGGNQTKADGELAEKAIIEQYLPEQLSEDQIQSLIDQAIAEIKPDGIKDMGQVIGAVKQKAGSSADGAVIARLVKASL